MGNQSQARVAQRQGIQAHPALAQRRQPAQERLYSLPQGQDRMDNPPLEIPLKPEQVQWVQTQANQEFVGIYLPTAEAIQQTAQELQKHLAGQATLRNVLQSIMVDF